MQFCVKTKSFLVHYIDTIQLAANSYLCFPTAPEKEEKEKKANDVDMGKNLVLLNNESCGQTFYHRLGMFYLPFLCSQIM